MTAVIDFNDVRRSRERGASFPARKFASVQRVMLDPNVSHLDFRVFYYIADATDSETELAKRKQTTIADALGICRRSVQLSLERLRDLGHIIFETKPGGTYVNAYRVAMEKAQQDAPLPNAKAQQDAPYKSKRRTDGDQKAHSGDGKGARPFAPILPSNSRRIPLRLRGPSSTDVLGPAGATLRQKLGTDVFESWFGKVVVDEETLEQVTLAAPSRFVASRIRQDFDTQMLEAWRAVTPTVRRIEVIVRDGKQGSGNQ